jgi:DNA-binding transcriptional LysR family regulator
MLHVIAPLVQGYRERYPHVTLQINTNDRIIDLLESRTALQATRCNDGNGRERAMALSTLEDDKLAMRRSALGRCSLPTIRSTLHESKRRRTVPRLIV